MMAPKVGIKVDGIMLLTLLAITGVAVIYFKFDNIKAAAGEALQKVNPVSDDNLAHQAVVEGLNSVTDGNYENAGEYIYETRLYNPLAWVFEGIGHTTGDLQ